MALYMLTACLTGLVLLITGLIVISHFFIVVISITGTSMEPTFSSHDRVVVIRSTWKRLLQRGRVVVGISSKTPLPLGYTHPESFFIKRVTGLPGEVIITHRSEALPFLDLMNQSIAYDAEGYHRWYIPPSHYFLRGDSRGVDSLVWGPVPHHALIGIVLAKLPNGSKIHATMSPKSSRG